MKTILLIVLLLIFSVGVLPQDNTDFGLWNDIQVTKAVNKTTDVLVGLRFDTKKDTSKFSEQRVYGAISWRSGKWTVQPMFVFLKNFGAIPFYESRPQVTVSYKVPLDKTITLTPRVRAEYHFKHGRRDAARIVPGFLLTKKLNKDYSLFNSTEFWVSNRGTDVAQFRKRLFFGVTRNFNKKLSVDFFYLYQRDEQVAPKNTHKLGLTWKVKL